MAVTLVLFMKQDQQFVKIIHHVPDSKKPVKQIWKNL